MSSAMLGAAPTIGPGGLWDATFREWGREAKKQLKKKQAREKAAKHRELDKQRAAKARAAAKKAREKLKREKELSRLYRQELRATKRKRK